MSEFESSEDELFDEVSKSNLKRSMLALQDLGRRLMDMKVSAWDAYGLNESVISALEESKRITSPNALNRHARRMGKLLSVYDDDFITQLIELIVNKDVNQLRYSQRLERLRDRLFENDQEAFNELNQQCATLDRQHLRQLLRNAQKEKDVVKQQALKRKLFKYLKTLEFESS